jgi:glycosyltransferase involved in cell wall biosynthesis
MSSPRVTVVMATYNWSTVLPYSIGSALRQTFADFELLVVGDGCTDDSDAVVASIGDPRVRWINLPANTGHQSGPNNEGLRQARGELIAYLGHDDLWLPHHLASAVAAIDGGADVASGIMAWVGADGRVDPLFRSPRYFPYMVAPSSIMHRRRVTEDVGGWRPHDDRMTVPPDTDLWMRMEAAGYRFASVPRLSGIKIPAGPRRDVYKTRPYAEQAHWLARIESEPDLEMVQLAAWLADCEWMFRMRYRELVRHFVRATAGRIRRRLAEGWSALLGRRRGNFQRTRKFKGL